MMKGSEMLKVYHDEDAKLENLRGKVIAILGYGNQGRAQGLNLRDSGISVIVGSQDGQGSGRAKEDGFEVLSFAQAAEQADIILLLLPDELQRAVFKEAIESNLSEGKTLVFAHGYNIRFGFIQAPREIDVVMMAPRMIGINVRQLYIQGSGAPAYVGVHQDSSGHALETALALAKGIGATRTGVIEQTFAEETELDLFLEQAVWPAIYKVVLSSYEFLVENGFSPEVAVLELYGSREAAEIFEEMGKAGIFQQMVFHSQTSRYGSLSRVNSMLREDFKGKLRDALEHIRSGKFAEEWLREEERSYPAFKQLKESALGHPINLTEERLKRLMR